MQTTLAEANKVAEETISSMKTVRSFANEGGEADSYYAKLWLMFRLNKKQALAYACYMWSSNVSVSSHRTCLNQPVTVSHQSGLCAFYRSQRSDWRSLSSTMVAIL